MTFIQTIPLSHVIFARFLYYRYSQNSQIDVIYTEFSKAFDKINHDILNNVVLNYKESSYHS